MPSVLQTTAQGIYVVAVDERPAWALAQDKQIELFISQSFQEDPVLRNLDHLRSIATTEMCTWSVNMKQRKER